MSMIWRPGFMFDVDASNYIEAVEAADGQQLETAVRYAYNDFFIGCKEDGTFSALKACCIMAGARTLQGALVPLVGPAPTNVGFAAGDYDRKTGLNGNGTAYLNTNRNNNAEPQDSKHLAAYCSTVSSSNNGVLLGSTYGVNGSSVLGRVGGSTISVAINATGVANLTGYNPSVGFVGATRSTDASINYRYISGGTQVSGILSESSQPPTDENINFLRFSTSSSTAGGSFYSIGEHLKLALLDARVTTLMQALSIAIP
jgi:hypothetical protein